MKRARQLTFQKLDSSPLKQLQKASGLLECKEVGKEGQKEVASDLQHTHIRRSFTKAMVYLSPSSHYFHQLF